MSSQYPLKLCVKWRAFHHKKPKKQQPSEAEGLLESADSYGGFSYSLLIVN